MRIKILDSSTANKIAAGEVVENPASVVKELMENSLDADADKITVEIDGGGLDSIAVTDNGSGIFSDDLEKAFQRYGTSKIRNFGELWHIGSFGFRGEALPSIASVSKIRIITRTGTEPAGTEMFRSGNITESVRPAAFHGTGCKIEIKHLFYNTPVRKKYLRSPNVEESRIKNLIMKYSFAHPEIHFILVCSGEECFNSAEFGDRGEILKKINGVSPERKINKVEFLSEEAEGVIHIFDSLVTAGNRRGETIFVNGRLITDDYFSGTVESAWREVFPSKRFPVFFLDMKTDPSLLDVNIHPAKETVKFSSGRKIGTLLAKSILGFFSGEGEKKAGKDFLQKPGAGNRGKAAEEWPGYREEMQQPELILEEKRIYGGEERVPSEPVLSFSSEEKSLNGQGFIDELVYRAHFDKTFIFFEGKESLYIADQHTLHERINYEKIKNIYDRKEEGFSQEILIPQIIDLNAEEAEVFLEYILEFRDMGFIMESFGDNSYIIRSVPFVLTESVNPEQIVRDIINEILDSGRNISRSGLVDRMIRTAACHSSVLSGKVLTEKEAESLLAMLKKCRMPYRCPHGRPIFYEIPKKKVRDFFER